MSDFDNPALRRLQEGCGDAIVSTHAQHGDATVVVVRTRMFELLRFLRNDRDCACEVLSDLTVVDHLGREPRFEVVYHLHSLANDLRLRLKVEVAEDDAVLPSAVPLYAAADWLEREAFDLYGVRFEGHPDLRRILLADSFVGHPLRKDHPKAAPCPPRPERSR